MLQPNEAFHIQFPSAPFVSSAAPISYYTALTQSHTPLPIWLSFNPHTLQFTGTAPGVNSEIAPSQIFPISIIAVQTPDYASAQLDFNLVLGAHPFTTNISYVNQTVTPQSSFSYDLPLDKFTLNGAELSSSNISSVTLNATNSWLTANSSTISGTVPKGFTNTSYLVTVEDNFKDSISFVLTLLSTNGNITIFDNSTSLSINATDNQYFQYQLPNSLIVNSNANISASYSPSADWLTFHQDNETFTGMVPSSFSGTTVTLTGKDGSTQQAFSFDLKSVKASPASPTNTSSSTPIPTSHHGISHNKLVAILCGVLIPVGILLIAAILLLFFCCCRRRRDDAVEEEKAVHTGSSTPPGRRRKGINIFPSISAPKMLPGDSTNDNHRIFGRSRDKRGSSLTSMTPKPAPFILPAPDYQSSPLELSRNTSLDTLGTQHTPQTLVHQKSWGTPTLATEYNLKKLDNMEKEKGFTGGYPGPFGMSPASNTYSEGTSGASDATQIDDSASRAYAAQMNEKLLDTSNILKDVYDDPHVRGQPSGENLNQQQNDEHQQTNEKRISMGNAGAFGIAMASGDYDYSAIQPPTDLTNTLAPNPSDEESIANPAGHTRNSWRQTFEPSQPWRSRTHGSSLATIPAEELKSVRLVDEVGKQQQVHSQHRHVQSFSAQHKSVPSNSGSSVSSGRNESHSSLASSPSHNDRESPILQRLGSLSSASDYNGRDTYYSRASDQRYSHVHGPSIASNNSNSTSVASYSSSDSDESRFHQSYNSTQYTQPNPYAIAPPTMQLDTVPESPGLSTPQLLTTPQLLSTPHGLNTPQAFTTTPIDAQTPQGLVIPLRTGVSVSDTPNAKFTSHGNVVDAPDNNQLMSSSIPEKDPQRKLKFNNIDAKQGKDEEFDTKKLRDRSGTTTSLENTDLTDAYRTASSGESCYGDSRRSVIHHAPVNTLSSVAQNSVAPSSVALGPKFMSVNRGESDADDEDFTDEDTEEERGEVLQVNQGKWTVTPRSAKRDTSNVIFGQAISSTPHFQEFSTTESPDIPQRANQRLLGRFSAAGSPGPEYTSEGGQYADAPATPTASTIPGSNRYSVSSAYSKQSQASAKTETPTDR